MYVVVGDSLSFLICVIFLNEYYIHLISIPVSLKITERKYADIKVKQSCGMSSATRYHCLKRIQRVHTDIQPHVYRKIIDDVIANVGVDFEEYGMDEAVLIALQAV
jgi:hypothetical protein